MIYVTKHAHQFSPPPGQAGAIPPSDAAGEVVVTPEMVEAGVRELCERSLGEGLPYLLEVAFRAMAYKSPQLRRSGAIDK